MAVGASSYRKQFCKRFLEQIEVSVIKGNASELLTLVDSQTTMKGTDSDSSLDAVEIARKAHKISKQQLSLQVRKTLSHKIIKLLNLLMAHLF